MRQYYSRVKQPKRDTNKNGTSTISVGNSAGGLQASEEGDSSNPEDPSILWPIVRFTNGETVLFKQAEFSIFSGGVKAVRNQVRDTVQVGTVLNTKLGPVDSGMGHVHT